MITRLHVDNFRSLVNFDISFDRFNLLLGANGAGKTTVIDVISMLRQILRGRPVEVPAKSLTRWESRDVQRFEVDLQEGGHLYRYSLELQHDVERDFAQIRTERLECDDGQVLFEAYSGKAQLYRDDKSKGPEVLADRRRSSLPIVQGRVDNKLLTQFTSAWNAVRIFVSNPTAMNAWTEGESDDLRPDLANFASWWRHVHSKSVRAAPKLQAILSEVLPGFDGLQFDMSDRKARLLEAVFGRATYGFDELSDGQRALIALHALLVDSGDQETTLCLDEPDNYVALREIQPFCNLLAEQPRIQTIMISHHPEILDLHALESGLVFRRGANEPVRVERFKAAPGETLTVSELIARGHLDAAQ